MELLNIGFRNIKIEMDEKKVTEIFKYNSVKTKIDVDVQPTIGTAQGKPPALCIDWFHYTKFQWDVIITFTAQDCYLCQSLDNFEKETDKWNKIIINSYKNLTNNYKAIIIKYGKGSNQPSFDENGLNAIRGKIITSLKNRI